MAKQGMRAAILAAMLATTLAATATHAAYLDPPLSGELLVADTHGQPFCRTPEALRQYTIVTVRQELFPPGGFPLCTIAPYATHVVVLEDLPPRGSLMHMVRASASTALQQVVGYTWSVGLYDPHRFKRLNPDGDYFPTVP